MMHEQRVITKFLLNDGFDARQITEKLRTQFHKDVNSFCTIQFWIGEMRRGREDLYDAPQPGKLSDEHITDTIQQLFDEDPFESARSIAETIHILHSPVLKHLHEDFHFQSFYLRWVPHLFTSELREQRYRYASEIIPVSTAAARDGWHHLVTENESRVC
jgi:hypothetical protein